MNPKKTEDNIPITEINAASFSFRFLKKEPEIYPKNDLKKNQK